VKEGGEQSVITSSEDSPLDTLSSRRSLNLSKQDIGNNKKRSKTQNGKKREERLEDSIHTNRKRYIWEAQPFIRGLVPLSIQLTGDRTTLQSEKGVKSMKVHLFPLDNLRHNSVSRTAPVQATGVPSLSQESPGRVSL